VTQVLQVRPPDFSAHSPEEDSQGDRNAGLRASSAVTVAAGVSRGGWDHPNPALARFGVVYFDEISAYNTNGHQPFPASSDAVTMVDQNGTTLARPDMLTDYAFKTIFVAA
jgi:hypothetical protein